ncbi:ATP-binding protein [Spirosoma sp. RP8]|uniref:ATP-binding protein n=1 Tax=Spirosoma liriopis TaxID=2937440 RepID=A0ABT0HNN4_9BACT|nr:sensor histidine kinase [Spirosoma liriopis]MCK8493779.1 ATP-binding protein [Spirosoma liriopis]
MRNCLVLCQYREDSNYNDFIGKFYHFPANEKKTYLNSFDELPLEFIYYEPTKSGKGVFFGYGKITKPPFPDKRQPGYYFVELDDFKPFTHEVSYKDESGKILESESPYYNSQNAVRKISSRLLDEICLDGGIRLNFKTDAHLIKVLGEQLIGSEKVGILELVKNALDADATYCRVRLEKFPDIPPVEPSLYEFNQYDGPVIVIEDDGVGMTRQIIEDAWLRPATTFKTNIKEQIRLERKKALEAGRLGSYNSLLNQFKRNRVPLGEKGVGRFATHRLGRFLEIHTKTKDIDYELVLKIDWDLFDNYSNGLIDLDSIGVTLSRQKQSWNYGVNKSGTRIIIYGGRENFTWSKEIIEDINDSIIALNSPNPKPEQYHSIFRVSIECPQISDLPNEPIYKGFIPNFTFSAHVNEYGVMSYKLLFKPSPSIPLAEEAWAEKDYDLRVNNTKGYWLNNPDNPKSGYRSPKCGPFFIYIDVWYRDAKWTVGRADAKTLFEYLDNHGGVSIYRDNIIVYPPEIGRAHDWLDLAQRQIKQTYRMSYYHMIGNVEIEQLGNDLLVDKTNREGLIQNMAFEDLKMLVSTAITAILEVQYIGKRNMYGELVKGVISDPKRLGNVLKDNADLIGNITTRYPVVQDPFTIFDQIPVEDRSQRLLNLSSSLSSLRQSLQILESNQNLFTEWAGYGISVAVAIHELAKITSNFYNGAIKLLEQGDTQPETIINLKDASKSFRSELNRLGPLRAVRNEKKSQFNIMKSVQYTKDLYERKLNRSEINFHVNSEEDFFVWGRYTSLNQVLSNLIDNSCHWLGFTRNNRRISIILNSKARTVIIADNGPGVHSSIRPYLFQPGTSMKIPPSGLGLYICRHYMRDIGGDIYETHERERVPGLNGAQFTLDFENVPSSRELAKI